MTTSYKLGQDCKIYYCVAGIGGTPEWSELGNVREVNTNCQKGEADVTTRGNNGWKATAGTTKDASIDFEMVWDPGNAGFTAIQTAFMANSTIGIAAMDGPIATAGSQGLWADCAVTNFSRQEPLEGAVTVKVTVKPTYSANAPIWKTISGS